MNTFLISLTLVSSSVIGLVQSTTAQPQLSAVGILQKSADKLNSVKTLGYAYSFEYSYPSKERRMDINAQAYLDLKPGEAPGGFRFQFLGSDRLTIYNGSERFTADAGSMTAGGSRRLVLKHFARWSKIDQVRRARNKDLRRISRPVLPY